MEQIRKGMQVYSSDGRHLGSIGLIFPPRFRPDATQPPGLGMRELPDRSAPGVFLDLDISGQAEPLAAGQPTQHELGIDPGAEDPRTLQDVEARVDEGTDYKRLGDTLDTEFIVPEPMRDPRDVEGYIKIDSGLLEADLYVPMSFIDTVEGDRVMLSKPYLDVDVNHWKQDPRRGA